MDVIEDDIECTVPTEVISLFGLEDKDTGKVFTHIGTDCRAHPNTLPVK